MGLDPLSTYCSEDANILLTWPHSIFLLYKQDPYIMGCPMEPNTCHPIMWYADITVEIDLADGLFAIFESVWFSCVNHLRATDLKSKVYQDCMTPLLGIEFAGGDLVYQQQRH